MDPIDIDGRAGEGGGQILRTSLALSALTGRTLEMHHIRAGRGKPGLLRQHLTAVRAAAALCDAEVEGAELRSGALRFVPGTPKQGTHHFDIGSAGSAMLVAQTVLPILLRVGGQVRVEGGTHNQSAPPFDFVEKVFVPMLARMGADVSVRLDRAGFYPAGGGDFTIRVAPSELRPLEGAMSLTEGEVSGRAIFTRVPASVAARELAVLASELGIPSERLRPHEVRSRGPGNAVQVFLDGSVPELVTAFGKRGRPAEEVARDAVAQVRAYQAIGAPVGEYLADQLLIPLALGGGRFRTGPLSSHAETNVETIRAFLGPDALTVEPDGGTVIVSA
ncbi:MAG: RNA 3'-terminal phosphate cyclase [Deltaproteobacteria bacterium]|nr:RNA 3'-terminal phosphate cyclase [Deltaproteobacteria bacterium]